MVVLRVAKNSGIEGKISDAIHYEESERTQGPERQPLDFFLLLLIVEKGFLWDTRKKWKRQ